MEIGEVVRAEDVDSGAVFSRGGVVVVLEKVVVVNE